MALDRAKPFEPYNILERLQSYKVDDSLKTRILEIFTSHKGKYLFVDFWGSWCGPCMLEMPVYPKFIAQFSVDSIRFLFLSYEMRQQDVDEVQKKYGIEADFMLLSANEIRVLNNVLGFEEYPRHFLVDPDGRVINNDIWSISSGDEPNKAITDKVARLMTRVIN
jgi:thiol-disulfide isomerase/thioredoxin